MVKLYKMNIKTALAVFNIILLALMNSIAFAAPTIEQVNLSTHSFEGNIERIAFYFTEPVNENLYIEVYEFHYIMFPDLAPEEDTWSHEKQMSFMEDVLAGNAKPFQPRLSDIKVKKILKISPKETIKLLLIDNNIYYSDWKARHGRIFFRVKTDKGYFDENVYTMRVHCKHIDMRTFEKLKGQLQSLKIPLEHKNSSFAEKLNREIFSTYTQGHSSQFMLIHHEQETENLDFLFKGMKESIDKSDFNEAKKLVIQIEQKIREKEELFYKFNLIKNDNVINISIEDNINDYSFYDDPTSEMYIKKYSEPSIKDLMKNAHSVTSDHPKNEHSAHSKMLKPEKSPLTKGAVKLEKSQSFFTGSFPEEWDAVSIIIFYGLDQNYYLTHHFKRNGLQGNKELLN
jgi:hypothetical protein